MAMQLIAPPKRLDDTLSKSELQEPAAALISTPPNEGRYRSA
jgi:hypothetical protein